MNVRQGNMLKHLKDIDLLCFTANGVISAHDKLIMGKGFAKQVRDQFPGIDAALGRKIKMLGISGIQMFGLISVPAQNNYHSGTFQIGAFQTKGDWRDRSTYDLVRFSTERLNKYATENPEVRISLNYPAIGLGGLHKDLVYEYVRILPDSVTLWYL